MSGRIGAEVAGIDASTDLAVEAFEAVHAALLAHRVIFLRDQHLEMDEQERFARRFGTLTSGHPSFPKADSGSAAFKIDSARAIRADHWHTDVTFVERPPAISLLYAIEVPPRGGDTLWANTIAAYNELPDALKALADSVRVIHTNSFNISAKPGYLAALAALERERGRALTPNAQAREEETSANANVCEAEHPLVRVHPETGERSLLLGGWARRIAGLWFEDSDPLLSIFERYILAPENAVRWSWRAGDLAIWDNRSSQHYAVFDYDLSHTRSMRRVTTEGEAPVGVDGRPGMWLRGDTEAYTQGA